MPEETAIVSLTKRLLIGYLVFGIISVISSILMIYDAKGFYFWGILGLPLSFSILITSYGLSNQKQWSYLSALIINFVFFLVSIVMMVRLFQGALVPTSSDDPGPALAIAFLGIPLYILTFILATSVVLWSFIKGSNVTKLGKWIWIPFSLATVLCGWLGRLIIIPILLFFFIRQIKEFEFISSEQKILNPNS